MSASRAPFENRTNKMANEPTTPEIADLGSLLSRTVIELLSMWAGCFDGRPQNQHYLYRRVAKELSEEADDLENRGYDLDDEAAAARLRLVTPQLGNHQT
jgi:hypothetical protein